MNDNIESAPVLKVGDKIVRSFSYGGESFPPTEWTVRKINRCSYKVSCEVPNRRGVLVWFNLFLNKATGEITR